MVEIDDTLLRKLTEAGVISATANKILTDKKVQEQYKRFIKSPKISDTFKKKALESMGRDSLVDLARLSHEGKQELTAYRLAKTLLSHGQIHLVIGASDLYIQAGASDLLNPIINQIMITWRPKGSDYTRVIKITTWYVQTLIMLESFIRAIIARHVVPSVANGKMTISEPNGTLMAVTSLKLLNIAIHRGIPLEAVISLS
jgi:hypothetical protein